MKSFELIEVISTPAGFIQRYLHNLAFCETQIEAYEMTESEHVAIFKRRKYSGYDSFRKVKNRAKKK